MRIQVLNDLHSETQRLFIAGSKFAKGDVRISKTIPVLMKMGEKAPVMKKLGDKVENLVNAQSEQSAEALKDTGTFLYAVLATQGSASVDGEDIVYEGINKTLKETKVPYSRLKPIKEAFTTKKSGRLELITNAYTDGFLNDFRLYDDIVTALEDKYTEIPDFLQSKAIPSIGKDIIPYLLAQYKAKDGKANVRRLALLRELEYEGIEELAFDAIHNRDQMYAPEAIKALGNNPKNEAYLLELSKDKKNAIKEAAYIALVKLDSAQGKESVLHTLNQVKYKPAIEAAKLCRDYAYVNPYIEIVSAHLETHIKNMKEDKEYIKKQAHICEEQLSDLFGILDYMDYDEVYDFYTELIKNSEYFNDGKLSYTMYFRFRTVSNLCENAYNIGSEKALAFFEGIAIKKVVYQYTNILLYYFKTAINYYDKEKFYDVFSYWYKKEKFDSYNIAAACNFDKKEIQSIKNKLHKDWYSLIEKRKDIYGILLFLDEENKDSEEYEKRKDQVINILKEIKPRSRNENQRQAADLLYKMASENEKEQLLSWIYKI